MEALFSLLRQLASTSDVTLFCPSSCSLPSDERRYSEQRQQNKWLGVLNSVSGRREGLRAPQKATSRVPRPCFPCLRLRLTESLSDIAHVSFYSRDVLSGTDIIHNSEKEKDKRPVKLAVGNKRDFVSKRTSSFGPRHPCFLHQLPHIFLLFLIF